VPPAYPQDAFVKKVQGTVELEIVIDENGRVVRVRILRSIPLLDAAAVACVQQWVFAPAQRGGRPVAVSARAPIGFFLK
jgi:protein TonB